MTSFVDRQTEAVTQSRVSQGAFTASTSILLGLGLIAVVIRFYIRLVIQKSFATDDAFLLLAVTCLVTAIALLHTFTIDDMYFTKALLDSPMSPETVQVLEKFGVPQMFQPSIDRAWNFQKWILVVLTLTWCSLMAVKFSFLFFFRKLIDRVRYLKYYWWFVVIFNVGVLAYGTAVFYLTCPDYYSLGSMACYAPDGQRRIMALATSQMGLDLVGDFMILAIPCYLIWQIKIKWSQKVGLAISLCLTIFIIAVTIVRVAGIKEKGLIDHVWESYWLIIGGEIGVLMAAATAFRSFFVARNTESERQRPYGSRKQGLLSRGAAFIRKSLSPSSRRTKETLDSSENSRNTDNTPNFVLVDIPRGQMTGARTMIDAHGRSQDDDRTANSSVWQYNEREPPRNVHGIHVTRSYSAQFEYVPQAVHQPDTEASDNQTLPLQQSLSRI